MNRKMLFLFVFAFGYQAVCRNVNKGTNVERKERDTSSQPAKDKDNPIKRNLRSAWKWIRSKLCIQCKKPEEEYRQISLAGLCFPEANPNNSSNPPNNEIQQHETNSCREENHLVSSSRNAAKEDGNGAYGNK